MKANACVSSLAEASLESAEWKLTFISAYFRRSFSFKNNDRTCGSLWMLKVMNVTVLFKQLTVLNNTSYLFFFFFFFLISCYTDLSGLFFLLCGNFLLLWLLTAQQNVVLGRYGIFCVSLSPFFNLKIQNYSIPQ